MIFWLFVIFSALLVCVYPVILLLDWLGIYPFDWASTIALWIAIVLAVRYAFRTEQALINWLLNHWIGVGVIFATLGLAFQFAGLFVEFDRYYGALWIIGLGMSFVLLSILVALRISHRHVEFNSHKVDRTYRIVQISDVHVGSRGIRFLREVVRKVNALEPEYLVITGDLIDTSFIDRTALAPLADINAPMVFVVGNHEYYSGLDRCLSLLQELGITILRDSTHTHGNVQFVGVDDSGNPGHLAERLPSIPMSDDHYRILLFHRPLGWDAAQSHGIELMLSGHTHNGQIFPFNLLVKKQFKQIKGLYKNGGSSLYVSQGTGTWGPIMRLGSFNEVTCISVHPIRAD